MPVNSRKMKLERLFSEFMAEFLLAGLAQLGEPVKPATTSAVIKAAHQTMDCELRNYVAADVKRQPGLSTKLQYRKRLIHAGENACSSVVLVWVVICFARLQVLFAINRLIFLLTDRADPA